MDSCPASAPRDANKRKRGIKDAFQVKEYNPSGSGYATRIPDDEWEKHKTFLGQLHVQRYPRSEMRKALESRGITVTLPQLNSKMNKWGLRVYDTQGSQPQAPLADHNPSQEIRQAEQSLAKEQARQTQDFDLTMLEIQAFDSLPECSDIPLPNLEINEYDTSKLTPATNGKPAVLGLPEYLKALQSSELVSNLRSEEDWTEHILQRIQEDPDLDYYQKSSVYMLLEDVFKSFQWTQASSRTTHEGYYTVRALRSEQIASGTRSVSTEISVLQWLAACCKTYNDITHQGMLYDLLGDCQDLLTGTATSTAHAYIQICAISDLVEAADRVGIVKLTDKEKARNLHTLKRCERIMYGRPQSLGRMHKYIYRYLKPRTSLDCTSLECEHIQRRWDKSRHMVYRLLASCRVATEAMAHPLLGTDDGETPKAMLDFPTLYCALLAQWCDPSCVEWDTQKHAAHEFRRMDCVICLQNLIRRLGSVCLVAVAEATSLSLTAVQGVCDRNRDDLNPRTLSTAFGNVQTMAASDLRLIYYMSRRVLYGTPTTLTPNRQDIKTIGSVGLFVMAFCQFLGAVLKSSDLDSGLPYCPEKADSVSVQESENLSVTSDTSTLLGAMRRMKKRLKMDLSNRSRGSISSYIARAVPSRDSLTPSFLSSQFFTLSLRSSRSVSTISVSSEELGRSLAGSDTE